MTANYKQAILSLLTIQICITYYRGYNRLELFNRIVPLNPKDTNEA